MSNHDWFSAGVAVIVLILGELIRRAGRTYDVKFEEISKHMKDSTVHETDRDRESAARERQQVASELIRHIQRDDERFDSFSKKLDAILEAVLRRA